VSDADPYLDEAHKVLRNKFGFHTIDRFDEAERVLVAQRVCEGAPTGAFDLAHLRAIHRHLFQDIFDWAGELRTVDMTKDGDRFQFATKLDSDIAAIHRDLAAKDFLKGLSPGDFAREAALLIGDVNYVHPFREGNGRTQMLYLKQLAEAAGHPLDLTRVPAEPWIEASRASMAGDPEPLAALVLFALS
jgi:cell filamentation protein